jgi:hypothetical protein
MQYVNCGSRTESSDFFRVGLSWGNFTTCSKNSLLFPENAFELYRNYSIPSLITFRCNQQNHDFEEVQIIYGDEGSKVFSGGVVDSWLDSVGPSDPPDLGMLSTYHRRIMTEFKGAYKITRTGWDWNKWKYKSAA